MAGVAYHRTIWHEFSKNRMAFIAFVFIVILAIVAIFSSFIANDKPLIMKYNGKWYAPVISMPNEMEDFDFLRDPPKDAWFVMPPIPYRPGSYDLNFILAPPTSKHWLGTDGDGRDVAAQLIWGARVSLSVGLVAVGIAAIIGVLLGAIAGFYGGWVDIIISRGFEVIICFPTFFLILTVLAFVGPSIYNIMIVIGITGWTGMARLVRGECLKLKSRDFVTAAIVSGARDRRIILRHILPQALAPVLVSATFGVAGAILVESALSFLGFGVPPSTPSWGGMLSSAQQFMDVAWWLVFAPGVMIFLSITAYNIVGEAIRDALDPRHARN